ncbi:MAG: hypothetical protein OEU90_15740 [Gammaproteobacteria bacterium]|jgi:hypothetical protein|nr:hypothetical protein [Gammaproteobacteria bacterium]MDH3751655.1 hypothetical protein [Gammaproteobacteria bacterium]MDH3806905.1 hypothetical protein [Gammaproteobacteria bacterium]
MKNFLIWAILVGGIGYGGAKLYLHKEVSDAMDMAVLMMSPYADVEYDGVGSTLSGELTVDGVRVRVDGFRDDLYIDRIGIDTPSFFSLLELSDLASMRSGGMPDHIGFLIEGLRIPANADYYQELYDFSLEARGVADTSDAAVECTGRYGFSPKTLTALGYEDQVMSMSMTVHDDESRYSFDMTISMEDKWDMAASVALAGNLMTEMAKGPMYRPRLRDMRMEFTDRSLNQRVTKYCRQRGLSAEETLKAQIDTFKYAGESNGIEFDDYMLDPYKEFLLGKSTLVVTAKPSQPIAFSQIHLYKPSDVPALLNLAATAR